MLGTLQCFQRHHLMFRNLWSRYCSCPHSAEEAEAQRGSVLAYCHTAQKRQNWNLIHAARESRVLGFSHTRPLPCKGRELVSSLQEVKVPVVRFAFKEKSGSHLNPKKMAHWKKKKNHIYLLAWTIYSKLTGTWVSSRSWSVSCLDCFNNEFVCAHSFSV